MKYQQQTERTILLSGNYGQVLNIILEQHTYSSIYPPLFSGQKSDLHRDPSHVQVVYEKKKQGYCDTGWILSLEYNSNNYTYQ